jgi:mono/diheme cytochrome c family protein
MNRSKTSLLIALPIMLLLRVASAEDGAADLNVRAQKLLKDRCHRCHGVELSIPELRVLNRDTLVADRGANARRFITPGEPASSKLWDVVRDDYMPPNDDHLSAEEKDLLKQWITSGANFPAVKREGPNLDELTILSAINTDLQNVGSGLERGRQQSTRYFSLAHIYNNSSVNEEALRLHRAALSKAINLLSRGKEIVLPRALPGTQGTVMAVDLDDLEWDSAADWEKIARLYPYGIKPRSSRESKVLDQIKKTMGVQFPGIAYLRGDWFVVESLRPPLYHDLAAIPATGGELEKSLKIDVAANIKKNKVVRLAMTESGVSKQNRLIERHPMGFGGAYWLSYDFITNGGRGNLSRFPLGPKTGEEDKDQFAFEHAGGEIVYTRENGMPGFMLITEKGDRINEGPVAIVSDKRETAGSPLIVNAISCCACHKHGIIVCKDTVRDAVSLGNSDANTRFEELYPAPEAAAKVLENDRDDYLKVLERVIGPFLKVGDDENVDIRNFPEPISEVAQYYRGDLDLEQVAAELFHDSKALGFQLQAGDVPQRLGLSGLAKGGRVKRAFWSEKEGGVTPFQSLASALDKGTPVN